MPKSVVKRLNTAVNDMLKTPVTLERFAALNLEPVGGSPEDFARFLREDIQKYAKIIKTVGIQPQ